MTSHERSHKEVIGKVKDEKKEEKKGAEPQVKHKKEKTGMDTQLSIRAKMNSLKKHPILVEPNGFGFPNPCPESMRHLSIGDLASSDISWKMMTSFRPENKIDEYVFSRFRIPF